MSTRSSNYSQDEIDILLDSLEACPQLVSGEIGGKIPTKHHQKLAWEALAQRMSEGGGIGATRTGEQVRAKWHDLKYRVRQKINNLRRLKGTIEVRKKDLSTNDNRILSVMVLNNEAVVDKILNPSDLPSKVLQQLDVRRLMNFQKDADSKEKGIIKTEDVSNDASDHDWLKEALHDVENEFSEEEETHSANDTQAELIESLLTSAKRKTTQAELIESLLTSPAKRQKIHLKPGCVRSSTEQSSPLRAIKRKLVEEDSFQKKTISIQEEMARDINNIKLSINEMKNSINTYMKRVDQKFDKMIDLLAVALNVEPHDIKR